jgi:hypothetical protein
MKKIFMLSFLIFNIIAVRKPESTIPKINLKKITNIDQLKCVLNIPHIREYFKRCLKKPTGEFYLITKKKKKKYNITNEVIGYIVIKCNYVSNINTIGKTTPETLESIISQYNQISRRKVFNGRYNEKTFYMQKENIDYFLNNANVKIINKPNKNSFGEDRTQVSALKCIFQTNF